MIAIIGFLMGVVGGLVAICITTLPTLLLRGFGLLWGDRRIWLGLSILLASLFLKKWARDQTRGSSYGDPDTLHQMFEKAIALGGHSLIFAFGVIVLITLCFWGTQWKSPISTAPIWSAIWIGVGALL
ncbi:MAG: hypothetical protein AAF236_14465, partial [Verrucomicrobiota bacterium]